MGIYTKNAEFLYNARISRRLQYKYKTIEAAYAAGYLGTQIPYKDVHIKVEADGYPEKFLFQIDVANKDWYTILYERVAKRLNRPFVVVVYNGQPLHEYGLLNVVKNDNNSTIYSVENRQAAISAPSSSSSLSTTSNVNRPVVGEENFISVVSTFIESLFDEFTASVHANDAQMDGLINNFKKVSRSDVYDFVLNFFKSYTLKVNGFDYSLAEVVAQQKTINVTHLVNTFVSIAFNFARTIVDALNTKRSLQDENAVVDVIESAINQNVALAMEEFKAMLSPSPSSTTEMETSETLDLEDVEETEAVGAELRFIGLKFSTRKVKNAFTTTKNVVANVRSKSKYVDFNLSNGEKNSRFTNVLQDIVSKVSPGDRLRMHVSAGTDPVWLRIDVEENVADTRGKFTKEAWNIVRSNKVRRPSSGTGIDIHMVFPLAWARYRVRVYTERPNAPERWNLEGERRFNCSTSGVVKGNEYIWEQYRTAILTRDLWVTLKISDEILNARVANRAPYPYRKIANGPVTAHFPKDAYKCLQSSWDNDVAHQADDALALVYWASLKEYEDYKILRIRRASYLIWAYNNNARLDASRYEEQPIDVPEFEDEYTYAPVVAEGECPYENEEVAPIGAGLFRPLPPLSSVEPGFQDDTEYTRQMATEKTRDLGPDLPYAHRAAEQRIATAEAKLVMQAPTPAIVVVQPPSATTVIVPAPATPPAIVVVQPPPPATTVVVPPPVPLPFVPTPEEVTDLVLNSGASSSNPPFIPGKYATFGAVEFRDVLVVPIARIETAEDDGFGSEGGLYTDHRPLAASQIGKDSVTIPVVVIQSPNDGKNIFVGSFSRLTVSLDRRINLVSATGAVTSVSRTDDIFSLLHVERDSFFLTVNYQVTVDGAALSANAITGKNVFDTIASIGDVDNTTVCLVIVQDGLDVTLPLYDCKLLLVSPADRATTINTLNTVYTEHKVNGTHVYVDATKTDQYAIPLAYFVKNQTPADYTSSVYIQRTKSVAYNALHLVYGLQGENSLSTISLLRANEDIHAPLKVSTPAVFVDGLQTEMINSKNGLVLTDATTLYDVLENGVGAFISYPMTEQRPQPDELKAYIIAAAASITTNYTAVLSHVAVEQEQLDAIEFAFDEAHRNFVQRFTETVVDNDEEKPVPVSQSLSEVRVLFNKRYLADGYINLDNGVEFTVPVHKVTNDFNKIIEGDGVVIIGTESIRRGDATLSVLSPENIAAFFNVTNADRVKLIRVLDDENLLHYENLSSALTFNNLRNALDVLSIVVLDIPNSVFAGSPSYRLLSSKYRTIVKSGTTSSEVAETVHNERIFTNVYQYTDDEDDVVAVFGMFSSKAAISQAIYKKFALTAPLDAIVLRAAGTTNDVPVAHPQKIVWGVRLVVLVRSSSGAVLKTQCAIYSDNTIQNIDRNVISLNDARDKLVEHLLLKTPASSTVNVLTVARRSSDVNLLDGDVLSFMRNDPLAILISGGDDGDVALLQKIRDAAIAPLDEKAPFSDYAALFAYPVYDANDDTHILSSIDDNATPRDLNQWIRYAAERKLILPEEGAYIIFVPTDTSRVNSYIASGVLDPRAFINDFAYRFSYNDSYIKHSRKLELILNGQRFLVRRNFNQKEKTLAIDVENSEHVRFSDIPATIIVNDPRRVVISIPASSFFNFRKTG